MSYPIEILPFPDRKLIDCPLTDYFVIRHFELKDGEIAIDEETEKIRVQYICSPRERISDLSMSLLGVFGVQHINLTFTQEGRDKYMHYCQPDETVETPSINKDFTNDANRYFWCAPICRLHGEPFNYSTSNNPCTTFVMSYILL